MCPNLDSEVHGSYCTEDLIRKRTYSPRSSIKQDQFWSRIAVVDRVAVMRSFKIPMPTCCCTDSPWQTKIVHIEMSGSIRALRPLVPA